ncbi:MAG: tRNA (adenosine(37)-N6)-threonylcarbamoyltransferase complex dimerization subunit type 1 TsaB [Myxococcota bacterium]
MSTSRGLLLAVETATQHASVALLDGERLLAEQSATGPRPHSTRVLPSIDALLESSGASLGDIGGYAVSIGPGSFTGLRVAVATVKGLAFGDERPVVAPVSTLAALAASAEDRDRPVLAVLDARREEVYAGVFEGDVLSTPRVPEGVYTAEALASLLPHPLVLVGSAGEETVLDTLAARLGDVERIPPSPLRAERVGRLGARLLAAGGGLPPSALVPRYVRRAEAEVRRTGERFEAAAPDPAF